MAPMSVAKVYVRWTESAVPPATILGVNDLVIPWGEEAENLVETAKKQGYQVYLETTLEQAAIAAESAEKEGVTGIILKTPASEESKADETVRKLRPAYPKLKILALSGGGKQPEMRGWLVFQKNGILQVSSPTSQPWLDANLALIRHERAFETAQAPLYTFSWDVSDPLVEKHGPRAADYALAIAEAGAFHANLILELRERQQAGLASGEKETLADWEQVKRTIEFCERGNQEKAEAAVTVGVLTDEYESSYEAINLMARHNIPYRVRHSAGVKAHDLDGFDVVIAFAALGKELMEEIRAFAERGGVVVLVNLPGKYPWDSAAPIKTSATSTSYIVGKGRVIEMREAVTDPETFAQDIRRLMVKKNIPVSLWNSLTTLVVEYPGQRKGEAIVELVNYDEESTQVQVQVKGTFASARFESPQQGCCEKLKVTHVDGFTEFVVPGVVIGGRVHLQ
jgi:protein-tyrosine-phosphatase